MTTFDERESGFEAEFVHDADVEFRIVARGNRLFGQWAAARLGLSPAASDDYARAVVDAEFAKSGHAGVIDKVTADLAGLADLDDIRAAITATTAAARAQIMGRPQ